MRSSAGTSICVVAELMDMESVLTRSQALDLSTQLNSIPFPIDCGYAPLKRKLLSYYWMSKIKDWNIYCSSEGKVRSTYLKEELLKTMWSKTSHCLTLSKNRLFAPIFVYIINKWFCWTLEFMRKNWVLCDENFLPFMPWSLWPSLGLICFSLAKNYWSL